MRMTYLPGFERLAMDNDKDFQSIIDGAGPIAGLFILLIGIAIVLIWLSMNRQMKKINPDLPPGKNERRVNRELNDIAELEEQDDTKE
jgi:hypothetical protein